MDNIIRKTEQQPSAARRPKPIWGSRRIGELINRSPSSTNYLLAAGAIPTAKKVAGRWMADEDALLTWIAGTSEATR